jgi:hypothetical protein
MSKHTVTWEQLEETRNSVEPVILVGNYGLGYHREVLYDFNQQNYIVKDHREVVLRTRNAQRAAVAYNELVPR